MIGGGFGIPRATWEWDGARWERIDIPGPSWRTEAAMTYDSLGARVVLVGGDADPGPHVTLAETWTYPSR
jgi:hypothetical protein